MNQMILEGLKVRHSYDLWQGRNTLGENLFIWGLRLGGAEFPGWQSERIQSLQPVAAQQPVEAFAAPLVISEELPPAPRVMTSIWRREKGGPGALLTVNVYQCASAAEAQEVLLQLLGEFELLQMERQDDIGIGDVAFTAPKSWAVLFVRANVVVMIRNAGRVCISVLEHAREFDSMLIARPVSPSQPAVADLEIVQEGATEAEMPALDVSLGGKETARARPIKVAALPENQMLKFFSRSGHVELEHERLVHKADSQGPQDLEVYGQGEAGTRSRVLRFGARSAKRSAASEPKHDPE